MSEKQVVLSGQLVKYLEIPGQGTPIIFLHGWRSEASVWKTLMNKLSSSGLKTMALNLPGFGGSELPKQPFSVKNYSDLVLEFIKKLGLQKVVLVGHSFGGRVSIKLASSEPALVSKLVLIDSGGLRSKSLGREAKKLIAKILKPVFALPGMKGLREFIYKHMGAEDYLATPAMKDTFLKVVGEDLTEDLKNIQAETLIIWGGKDGETPLEDGRTMNRLLQNTKFAVFPKAGHFSFLDEPEQTFSLLVEFLK